MLVQSREAKVFTALLVSMIVVVIVLMALGKNPPSAGAFCLDSYNQLGPIEKAISSRVVLSPGCWNCIEIYYSGTKAGNIEQLASLSGLANPDDINCHFIVCNGIGGDDGQIQSTEKWQRQQLVIPGRTRYGDCALRSSYYRDTKRIWSRLGTRKKARCSSDKTIRICVIADGKNNQPTDYQIKRTQTLVEGLCRKFDIELESIYYPDDWQ